MTVEAAYTLRPSDKNKTLPQGKYLIEVAGVGDLKLNTDKFEITRDGKATVRITIDSPVVVAAKKEPLAKSGPQELKSPETVEGFRPLFNGKDLRGWSVDSGAKEHWKVENGSIKGIGAGSPAAGSGSRGWLLTDREYENFVLELEFQAPLESASGVGIRAIPGEIVEGLPHHLAIKLDRWSNPTYPKYGSIYYWINTFLQPSKEPKAVADGKWNKLAVQLQGDDLRVSVNGEEVQNLSLSDLAKKPQFFPGVKCKTGRIGLQQHTGEVLYRRINIKELPKASADPDRKAAEYALSIGGTVGVNDQESVFKAAADLPNEAFRLTKVDLNGCKKVTDAGLAVFKDCRNLTSLSLPNTQITNVGLANFKDCKNLTLLDLWDTKMTDAGLVHFKDCKNLTILQLSGTMASDAGLAAFKDCKNLSYLALGGTQVSDLGLVHFKDCKELTLLALDGPAVSDAGLAQFTDRKKLTKLDLRKTKVTASAIEKLKKALPNCTIDWDGGTIKPKAAVIPTARPLSGAVGRRLRSRERTGTENQNRRCLAP